jgi:hypothetical protein
MVGGTESFILADVCLGLLSKTISIKREHLLLLLDIDDGFLVT